MLLAALGRRAGSRLACAAAAAVGAYALNPAARSQCDPAPKGRVPLPPSLGLDENGNGEMKLTNLDVNIARVEDWKATIAQAKEAWAAGDKAAAEVLLRAALEKASYFGNESPPVATSMHNLAEALRHTGRSAEAITLYEPAIALFEKSAGPAHRTTTTCLLGLAAALEELGNPAGAVELYERAVRELRKVVAEEPKRAPGLAAILVRVGVQPRLLLAETLLSRGESVRAEREATVALGASPTDRQRVRLEKVLAECLVLA
ncbi:hypothetical protein T492DRAFT_1045316 [Pavlovales sp. CCMP2436]|nr:hypothetical protein T492DRAFT_1045316 [Pavlovales sp. CCMP2436]